MNRKYRCMACGLEWEGKRLLLDDKGNPHRFTDEPLRGGMTECWNFPKCKSIYVEWVNWEAILKKLGNYWESP